MAISTPVSKSIFGNIALANAPKSIAPKNKMHKIIDIILFNHNFPQKCIVGLLASPKMVSCYQKLISCQQFHN